jgi:chitinase
MKYILILLIAIKSFGQIITYDIYKNGVYIASTNNIKYTVTGLTPATTYTFYVIAKDVAGNKSAPSNFVTITTPKRKTRR